MIQLNDQQFNKILQALAQAVILASDIDPYRKEIFKNAIYELTKENKLSIPRKMLEEIKDDCRNILFDRDYIFSTVEIVKKHGYTIDDSHND